MTSWPILPNDLAIFGGRQTRSSLQIGTSSVEKVNLYCEVDECISCEMSCSDVFVRTGAMAPKKSLNLTA